MYYYDEFYGRFKEFGTRYMQAEPFMRPAMDDMKRAAQ